MRIGLLTSDLSYKHGWGTYSLSVIKTLQAQHHDLTILTSSNSEQIDGLTIHPILPQIAPQERGTLLKMILLRGKVAELLADCDVIHTTIEIYAPLVSLIAGQRPSFMTAHGSYINLPVFRSFPVNQIYKKSFEQHTIICVSHYTQKIAKQIVPKAETTVILNGINANLFSEITPQKADHPSIITVGGVKARKGTFELVQAVAKVRETLPDVQCYVLGTLNAEAYYVEKVRSEIKRLNLENTVHLLGFVSDDAIQDYYAKANVFALPSINDRWKFEGFGLATLEASSAGVAVIGTRDCGAEDVIEHDETGLLIAQDNIAEELPQALLKLLTQPDLAEKMGDAGRQKSQTYTWDNVGRQLSDLYASKLKRMSLD